MRKPESLRRWLAASLPELVAHPDQLQVFVEEGQIRARKSRTLSFEFSYSLNLLFQDFSGSHDRLIVPILAWIEMEQPELLQSASSEPFAFEAEILDGDRFDLQVTIQITEPVLVIPRDDNSGYDVNHPPTPAMPAQFAGVGHSWLRQCFAGRDLVAETRDPNAPPLTPAVPPEA